MSKQTSGSRQTGGATPAATPAAPAIAEQPTGNGSSKTVTVACKHPPGILMRVFEMDEYEVPVLGGGMRKERRAVAVGDPIKINGPAVPYGQRPSFVIAGGYALTPNVPADFARAWMEQNKSSDLVKNSVIFIHEKADYATEKAKEQRAVKSGLEPLDVGTTVKNGRQVPKDPRWPARTNPNLSHVATDVREDAA